MELIKTKARVFALTVPALAALMGIVLAGTVSLTVPPPVSAHHGVGTASSFYLECPTETVREGDSFEVYLVREPGQGHQDIDFGAWWHTDPGYADENDYVALPGESEEIRWSNNAERAANRQPRTVYTIDDDELDGGETFWVRFSPTDDVSDPDHPSRDEKCMITIWDDDPHVTSIEMVSSPARGYTYGVGEVIEFAATFNNPVDVHANVLMGFFIGEDWKGARYQRGSGTETLVFAHTVQPEDRDANGVSVHDGYVDRDGRRHGFGGDIVIHGTAQIPGVAGIPVYKIYKGIPNQSGHMVDGRQAPFVTDVRVVSTPAAGDTYRTGESIELDVTFSSPVEVSAQPVVILWFDTDDGWRTAFTAAYQSGSGTRTLRFALPVQGVPRDTDGLTIGDRHRDGLGFGTVKAVGTDLNANQEYREQQDLKGHKVDGRPRVASIAVTSTPEQYETYGLGETIEISATFDQPVQVTGVPSLSLGVGDTLRQAHYSSGSGTPVLVFTYDVASDDRDHNGVSIFAGSGSDGLGTSEASITAAGGPYMVNFDPVYDGLTSVSCHRVDGTVQR